jgi:hypothetical protein
MLCEYTVFNVARCENLPETVTRGKPMRVRNPDTRDPNSGRLQSLRF